MKLRKYLIIKPLIILILNEWFRSVIYWQIQWLGLVSKIVRYYHDITVISTHSFFNVSFSCPLKVCTIIKEGVHNYQGMLLYWVTFALFGVFQLKKNYLFKKFNRSLCVFLWTLAKWLLFGAYHQHLLWEFSLHLGSWTCISLN